MANLMKTDPLWVKIKGYLKPIGNWTLFTVSCLSAFCFGYYYPSLKKLVLEEETKVVKEVVVKDSKQCTISVTDRGELLILDRSTGTFEMYTEPVGMSVFKAYGNVLTSNQPK